MGDPPERGPRRARRRRRRRGPCGHRRVLAGRGGDRGSALRPADAGGDRLGHLLAGLLFGISFAVVEEISDDPFFATGFGRGDDFLYYSFSTLTTTGYGDLVAATDLGRSLSITEALIGQIIYLVTVVAVIIGNLRPVASRSRA